MSVNQTRRRRQLVALLGITSILMISCTTASRADGERSASQRDAPSPETAQEQASTAQLVQRFQSTRGATAFKAFQELQKRLSDGALSAETIAIVAKMIKRNQRDSKVRWRTAWGDFIESAFDGEAISRAWYEEYLEQSVLLSLRARQTVRMGDDVPLRVGSGTFRLGDVGFRNVEPRFLTVKAQPGTLHGRVIWLGFGKAIPNQIDAPFALVPVDERPLLPVGQHRIRFGLRLILRDGGLNDLHDWKMHATVTVTVLPAGEDSVRAIVNDELRDQVRNSITVASVTLHDDNWIRVELGFVEFAPIAFPFRVILRSGDQEWDAGFRGHTSPNGVSLGGPSFDAVGLDSDHVDVILRPDLDQARLSIDVFEIWGEEVVFEGVTIVGR